MNIPMNPNQGPIETTKDVLVKDLKVVVGDADALVREAASSAVDELSAARSRIEAGLSDAKSRAVRAQELMAEKARGAAGAACSYVSDNPWKVVGMAAVAGLVIGVTLSRRESE